MNQENEPTSDQIPVETRRTKTPLSRCLFIMERVQNCYTGLLGDLYVQFKADNGDSTAFRIRSEECHAKIAFMLFEQCRCTASPGEINSIQSVLAGRAQKDRKVDATPEELMDHSDLVYVVHQYLHDIGNSEVSTNAEQLLTKLIRKASQLGVDLKAKNWPKGGAQLSKALSKLKPSLRCCGIQMDRGSTGGNRFIRLSRIDSGDVSRNSQNDLTSINHLFQQIGMSDEAASVSSPPSSRTLPLAGLDFSQIDAGDGAQSTSNKNSIGE